MGAARAAAAAAAASRSRGSVGGAGRGLPAPSASPAMAWARAPPAPVSNSCPSLPTLTGLPPLSEFFSPATSAWGRSHTTSHSTGKKCRGGVPLLPRGKTSRSASRGGASMRASPWKWPERLTVKQRYTAPGRDPGAPEPSPEGGGWGAGTNAAASFSATPGGTAQTPWAWDRARLGKLRAFARKKRGRAAATPPPAPASSPSPAS